jgi:carboxylesterase
LLACDDGRARLVEEVAVPVLAGAEPFAHDGSDEIGVLLCHGFTGSPQSLRPWGDRLAAAGYTVRCPLLPGHGTSWQDMNRTGWPDWYGTVNDAFTDLAARTTSTFVFGLSMGGALALRLAQQHGSAVRGIVLVNPSVTTLRRDAALAPVLSRVVPSFPGVSNDIAKPGAVEVAYDRVPLRAFVSLRRFWKVVRDDLPEVTQPLQLYRSAVDHVVESENSRIVLSSVASTDTAEVVLPDSFHVATLDIDAETIFDGSIEFCRRVHAAQVGEPA